MLAAVIPAGRGEVVGDAPDRRVEILADGDALHATWSRFGPGREGADLHVHHHHTDLFYVLEGELTIRLGVEDRPAVAPAGTLVRVPPLVVHGFRNASARDVTYLNFHAPGRGFADFLRGRHRPPAYDQHDPPADGGRPVDEVVLAPPGEHRGGGAILVCEVTGAPGDALLGAGAAYVLEGEVESGGTRAGRGAWIQDTSGATVAGDAPARALVVRVPA